MILIVDDDISIRTSLAFLFKRAQMSSIEASNPKEAIAAIRQQEISLVIMDMNYSLTTSGEEGIHLLKQIKVLKPDIPVILITAWGSIQLAVKGMREGAFDFITKPWNNIMLLNIVKTALELKVKEDLSEEENLQEDEVFPDIVGKSPALKSILATVRKVAKTNASVLITGESGSGKELIAEAVHRLSKREAKPFVKVNLGGLSQSLFESEMFGHKRGSFTDAHSDRKGRFAMADGGTIFLDEIGDLEMSHQVKLLRVLQEQTFEMLGDSNPIKVDVRLITATNKDLPQMVSQNLFREDLMYRINLIPIHLPALRERREDIPLLVNHFAKLVSKREGLAEVTISSEAMDYLQSLPYEGNIRELKNLVERAIILSDGECLDLENFRSLREQKGSAQSSISSLEDMERLRIVEELRLNNNNISRTAKVLGLSRAALYRRLEKYQIPYSE